MKYSTLLGKVILVASLMFASGWAAAAPVNVNTADAQTLATNISGVGAKKAQAIIKYRKLNGPFKSAQDLIKVKGIGKKLIERNRDDLVFSAVAAQNSKKR